MRGPVKCFFTTCIGIMTFAVSFMLPADSQTGAVLLSPEWAGMTFSSDGRLFSTSTSKYMLLRCNFHVHSSYSADVHDGGDFTNLGRFDHGMANSPTDQCGYARQHGLHCIGFSDHAESLDQTEWESGEGSLLNVGKKPVVDSDRKPLIVLPGFEWTIGGLFKLKDLKDGGKNRSDYVAHINIWGTSTPAGASYHSTGPSPKNMKLKPSLSGLYEWLAQESSHGNLVIAQFNHPRYGRSPHFAPSVSTFTTSQTELDEGDFALPSFPEEKMQHLLDTVALLEVGSGSNMPTLYESPRDGEKFFVKALQQGWRGAPTINADNFGDLKPRDRTKHTAVWIELNKTSNSTSEQAQRVVLEALRARRVFASESRDAVLEFSLEDKFMGETIELSPINHRREQLRYRIYYQDSAASDLIEIAVVSPDILPGETKKVQEFREMKPREIAKGKTLEGTISYEDEPCFYVAIHDLRDDDAISIYSAPVWVKGTRPKASSALFLIDRSGSILSAQGVMAAIQNKAEEVVAEIQQRNMQAAVINFSGESNFRFDARLTRDPHTLRRAIAQPSVSNTGTAIYDAITAAVDYAEQVNERCFILLFTDGVNHTGRGIDEGIRRAQKRRVPVVIVGYTGSEGRNESDLRRLAEATGGFYVRSEEATLEQLMGRFELYTTLKEKNRPKGKP